MDTWNPLEHKNRYTIDPRVEYKWATTVKSIHKIDPKIKRIYRLIMKAYIVKGVKEIPRVKNDTIYI